MDTDDTITELRTRIASLESRLHDALVREPARRLLEAAGAYDADDLMPVIERHVRPSDAPDAASVEVLDAQGRKRWKSAKEPFALADFIAELRQRKGHLFRDGLDGGAVRCKADLPSVRDQAAFIGRHGREAYLALPES